MDRMTRLFVTVMVTLAASIGIANAGVTTVTLRGTVRLAPDAPITLGSIAKIDGDQADRLASLAIATEPVRTGAWTPLDVETVRSVIAESAAAEGSIVVIGQQSSLTRVAVRAKTETDRAPSDRIDTSVVTVRDHLESWLRARFRAAPDNIRVTFNERDTEIVGIPTDGRMVGVVEIGSSSRIALRVTVYEGERIVLTESVRVGVELRTLATVVDRPLRRGTRIAETDVRQELVWHDPTEPPAPSTAVIGQVLLRSAEPGQILRDAHLEPPVLIERGQDVSVRTVRGTIVVSTTARARHDASMGELIELEAKDGSRRRYTARVAGPGRAVMTQETLSNQASNERTPQTQALAQQPKPAGERAPSTTAKRKVAPPTMHPISSIRP